MEAAFYSLALLCCFHCQMLTGSKILLFGWRSRRWNPSVFHFTASTQKCLFSRRNYGVSLTSILRHYFPRSFIRSANRERKAHVKQRSLLLLWYRILLLLLPVVDWWALKSGDLYEIMNKQSTKYIQRSCHFQVLHTLLSFVWKHIQNFFPQVFRV